LPEEYPQHPWLRLVDGKQVPIPYAEYLKEAIQGVRQMFPQAARNHQRNRLNMERAARKAVTPEEKEWWRRVLLLDKMLDEGKVDLKQLIPRSPRDKVT
jgi:hypothetical protein